MGLEYIVTYCGPIIGMIVLSLHDKQRPLRTVCMSEIFDVNAFSPSEILKIFYILIK